jgi:hypothetical protein
LIGTLVLGSLGYEFGPHPAAQIKNLDTAVPEILEGLSSGRAAASLGSRHGLSAAQQLRIQDMLARHHDLIEHVFERGAASAAYVAASAIWLFAIPILAIFPLEASRAYTSQYLQSLCCESCGWNVSRLWSPRLPSPISRSRS